MRTAEKPERNKSFIHRDLGRGEVVGGIIWLCVGALASLLLEVFYLGVRITLPGGFSMPFPYMIIVAFLFNMVLTRTAMLWTRSRPGALAPLGCWLAGFIALLVWSVVVGDQLLSSNLRTVLLLSAGAAGGIWPLVRGK